MLYFPQLLSGAIVQYPFVKRRVRRTISSSALGGQEFKLLDPGGARAEWEVEFHALTNPERAELESFFSAAEGKLGEFTLLDPADNLLVWSEDLSSEAWTKGPFIGLTGGVADPDGGSKATRIVNGGGASQSVEQTIPGPGWFHYCFSLYARSQADTILTLLRSIAGAEQASQCTVSPSWRRLVHSAKTPSEAESVIFGIRLEAGATVEVYGMQAEAQPAPSAYRKTTSRCGIYARARFDHDILSLVAEGPEEHSCKVRIVAPEAA